MNEDEQIDVTTFGQGMFDFLDDMTDEEREEVADRLIDALEEIASE